MLAARSRHGKVTVMDGRNYQILKTIATGGASVLYKAIQTSLDREVVIKKLHAHLTSDRNFTSRFSSSRRKRRPASITRTS